MKIKEINPEILSIAYFKYDNNLQITPRLSLEKTQYSYRFIAVSDGYVDVCFDNKTERLLSGDALYLLPGENYKLLPCGVNFSLYSIYFDYFENKNANKGLSTCVFLSDFKKEKMLCRLVFEDAKILNKSAVFKNINFTKIKELLYSDNSEFYALFNRAVLLSIIADIISSQGSKKPINYTAKKIVNYIKTHPESELMPELLAKKFSYHKNHVNKLVKEETGKSLIDFIRFIKIEYAKTLLFETEYSLVQISQKLGYYDYSHFYKAFVKETKTTPTKYRKS